MCLPIRVFGGVIVMKRVVVVAQSNRFDVCKFVQLVNVVVYYHVCSWHRWIITTTVQ